MYWKVREETLFIIKPPYKMELGSDLGEHDSDTVFLATERERCLSSSMF